MEDASSTLEEPAAPAPDTLPDRIIFYDGVCGMCNWIVQRMITLDQDQKFHFAPLQGDTCRAIKAVAADFPQDIDTVVYVEQGQIFLRSQAFFAAAAHMRRPWRFARWLRIFPALLSDAAYRVIARYRYAWFGRYDSCRLPSPEERARFLP